MRTYANNKQGRLPWSTQFSFNLLKLITAKEFRNSYPTVYYYFSGAENNTL